MTLTNKPVFGKRNRGAAWQMAPIDGATPREGSEAPSRSWAAFFAYARRDAVEPRGDGGAVVRTSLLAATLAGVVVGCAFVGLDMTGNGNTFVSIVDLLPDHPEAKMLVPFVVLCGLLAGGRSAATSLLVTHSILGRARLTSIPAYIVGGAAAASAVAWAFYLLLGQTPTHGFALDAGAGAVGGFLYRIFAGAEQREN